MSCTDCPHTRAGCLLRLVCRVPGPIGTSTTLPHEHSTRSRLGLRRSPTSPATLSNASMQNVVDHGSMWVRSNRRLTAIESASASSASVQSRSASVRSSGFNSPTSPSSWSAALTLLGVRRARGESTREKLVWIERILSVLHLNPCNYPHIGGGRGRAGTLALAWEESLLRRTQAAESHVFT
jgi:hypothetical protein